MEYGQVREAVFLKRLNRFAARVGLEEGEEIVHVKNTGRLGELLLEGAKAYILPASNPDRRTRYDMIAVRNERGKLFNIDSQAPNRVTGEWLKKQGFSLIRPEYTHGDSRLDFYLERGGRRGLMEIKGCTLEREGVGFFPDAPTERGVKHLRDLARAARDGWRAAVAFVIQMEGVYEVRPNDETHPEFARALEEAKEAGVKVLFLPCRVEPGKLEIAAGPELSEWWD